MLRSAVTDSEVCKYSNSPDKTYQVLSGHFASSEEWVQAVLSYTV